MAKKTGRITNLDLQYIKDNAFQKNYKQIAEELGRDPVTIRDYIEKELNVKTTLATGARPVLSRHSNIREEEFWPTIQKQFAEDELNMFEYYWNQINDQFDNDILPTEKLQVIDVVRYEILMSRCLKDIHGFTKNLSDIEYQLTQEKSKDFLEQDRDFIIKLETQITANRVGQVQLTKEVREIQEKKDKLLTSLRATRGDRIKRIENKKENFFTWLEELIENPERRKQMGLAMEKMRLSMIDEEIRLTAYHKYIDNSLDRPLLTCVTVAEEEDGQENKVE
jgi:predicted transcriptional regulator